MLSSPKKRILLGVTDTARSIVFYKALLGEGPASRSRRSAVFDLDSPPVVLTIELRVRVAAPEERYDLLVEDPRRVGHTAVALRRAGVKLRLADEGIEAVDPDGHAWRVRLAPAGAGRAVVAPRDGGAER